MQKRFLIPFALMLLLVLAACSGQKTAEPASAAPLVEQQEVSESPHDDDMDSMEDNHEDETMETADHEDDMDEASHDDEDEASDDDAMDDDGDHMDDNDGMDDDHDTMDDDDAMDDDDDATESESMAAVDLPVWQTVALTEATTGETFTLGDFHGKTVFVEPMATWCSNCKQQQGQVLHARTQFGDDVVFVGLSLETTLPADQLALYAKGNGFDWTYAVMSVDLLEGLADEFGRSITSAPSTPHFVIRPDGTVSELSTGIHSSDQIISEIQEAQG